MKINVYSIILYKSTLTSELGTKLEADFEGPFLRVTTGWLEGEAKFLTAFSCSS